jgi:hypothetical protein
MRYGDVRTCGFLSATRQVLMCYRGRLRRCRSIFGESLGRIDRSMNTGKKWELAVSTASYRWRIAAKTYGQAIIGTLDRKFPRVITAFIEAYRLSVLRF